MFLSAIEHIYCFWCWSVSFTNGFICRIILYYFHSKDFCKPSILWPSLGNKSFCCSRIHIYSVLFMFISKTYFLYPSMSFHVYNLSHLCPELRRLFHQQMLNDHPIVFPYFGISFCRSSSLGIFQSVCSSLLFLFYIYYTVIQPLLLNLL